MVVRFLWMKSGISLLHCRRETTDCTTKPKYHCESRSNKVIPVDIRLISATNKDIPEMIKEGLFREDLFYRINTIHLEIPL